jgi:hypothetical protein
MITVAEQWPATPVHADEGDQAMFDLVPVAGNRVLPFRLAEVGPFNRFGVLGH